MVFLFFDTNVIQNLHSFGEFIFDNYLPKEKFMMIKQKYGSEMFLELDALRQIVFVLQRGSLPVAISVKSLREFLKIYNRVKRNHLVNWNLKLLEWWEINKKYVKVPDVNQLRKARRLVNSGRIDFLTDSEDKLLVAEALVLGCNTFLTFDRKTVLCHKKKLARFGIDVLNPREFVNKYRLEMSG